MVSGSAVQRLHLDVALRCCTILLLIILCVRNTPAAELDGKVYEEFLTQLADKDLGVSQFQVRYL